MRSTRLVLAAFLLGACSAPIAPSADYVAVSLALDTHGLRGLSGLASGADGTLWAIAEGQDSLARIRFEGGVVALEPVVLADVPKNHPYELESLAVLADGRLAIGTEQWIEHRIADPILFAEPSGDHFRVVSQVEMPYSLWNIEAHGNQGIEGLCAAGDILLALGETVFREEGQRVAPLGRYRPRIGQWTPFRLRLTSASGKPSSLACRAIGDGDLEVLAIERHYGVAHVLQFTVPAVGPAETLIPEVLADIAPLVDSVRNLEGIEWLPDGSLALIVDDSYDERPDERTFVQLRRKP